MEEEQFDILHEDGSPAGYSLPRSQVHREGQWHRSVHIWVVDEWERILFQQRSFHKDSNPGLWDISAAGHISVGQESREAAVREVGEELGLVISADQLQFLFEDKDQAILQDGKFIDHEFHDIYLLRIGVREAKLIKPDPIELEGIRWMSPEAFAEELQTHGECFVNHSHEYPKILALFGINSFSFDN